MTKLRRLPLKKLKNARDLGGYPTAGGGMTRYAVFIRTEVPSDLPAEDVEYLREYGVKTCMDFRGEAETRLYPSSLRDLGWAEYKWMPMFARMAAPQGQKGRSPIADFVSWDKHYIDMCEHFKPWVKDTLEVAAGAEGGLIYNCTTGKDRTGIFSALLLSIAGAFETDIISDYCISMVYMHDVYASLDFPPDLPEAFYETPPGAMRSLLKYFEAEYGSARDYILSSGLDKSVIEGIQAKFVTKI